MCGVRIPVPWPGRSTQILRRRSALPADPDALVGEREGLAPAARWYVPSFGVRDGDVEAVHVGATEPHPGQQVAAELLGAVRGAPRQRPHACAATVQEGREQSQSTTAPVRDTDGHATYRLAGSEHETGRGD